MSLCTPLYTQGCAPSEAWKLCILETESCNLVNTFRWWKQNPSFTGSTDLNCALCENFTGGTDDYTAETIPWSNTRGYIPHGDVISGCGAGGKMLKVAPTEHVVQAKTGGAGARFSPWWGFRGRSRLEALDLSGFSILRAIGELSFISLSWSRWTFFLNQNDLFLGV